MGRYRYLIEASGDELEPFHATTVDAEGEAQSSSGLGNFRTVEEAKRYCEESAQSGEEETFGDRVALVWKLPPAAWQPDAIVVSQFLTDMYPGLPV